MSKLPLEILKEKYVPLVKMPELYDIPISVINNMISEHKIPYTEFKAPGESRRTVHVNPEDVLRVLEEDSQ